MEEQLPIIDIEVFIEDDEVNVESIMIMNIVRGSFPLSDIALVKDCLMDQFNGSGIKDDWIEIQLRYVRDNETGDYYEIIKNL